MDDTEQHSLSYRYSWLSAFCIPISHIYPSVGYCVVYFRLGLTTTFKKINESRLHTFFIYTLNYLTELRILDCYGCSYTSISHSYRVVERLRQDRWKICRKHRVLQVSHKNGKMWTLQNNNVHKTAVSWTLFSVPSIGILFT